VLAAVLLPVPYAVLAAVSYRRAHLGGWVGILLILFASTLAGLAVTASSSTGGLIFLWLWPLQLVIAAGLLLPVFRDKG
jgi:hypothetical protein